MKFLAIVLISLFAGHLMATTTPEEAQRDYLHVMSKKTRTIWSCKKDGLLDAVSFFNSSTNYGGQTFIIKDTQICDALGVVCPFVSLVVTNDFWSELANVKYKYLATRGQYQDTVLFVSEGPGMKLYEAHNGPRLKISWNRSWYFHPGECVLNN
jgi:hypothetical protein